METECRVRIVLYDTGDIPKIKKRTEELSKDSGFIVIDDVYADFDTSDEGVMEITAETNHDWGDLYDPTSESGTEGGDYLTFDCAKSEIKELMDTLYMEDLIADRWYEKDLPDDDRIGDAA